MTDETKAVVPYQKPEVAKPEREPVRNTELREERKQQYREERQYDRHEREPEEREQKPRKRSGVKRFLRKGVNFRQIGDMAQRSQENSRREVMGFGSGILNHDNVDFSSYADPFAFGSLMSGTGLQWGNADPFRSINWMSGTPGRKGLFDLQGGIFAQTSGLQLGRSIFRNNDTPRKKKRRPRRR